MATMSIPVLEDLSRDQLDKITASDKTMNEFLATQKKLVKIEELKKKKAKKQNKKLDRFQKKFYSANTSTTQKIKDKLFKVYDKVFIKGKYFKKMLGFAKDGAKESASMFLKILGFLMIMTMIGPKKFGKIMKWIIGFLMTFLKMFLKMLPQLVDTLFTLIEVMAPIIWDALKDVASLLWKVFTKGFKTFWDSLFSGNSKGMAKGFVSMAAVIALLVKVGSKFSGILKPLTSAFKMLGKGIAKTTWWLLKKLMPSLGKIEGGAGKKLGGLFKTLWGVIKKWFGKLLVLLAPLAIAFKAAFLSMMSSIGSFLMAALPFILIGLAIAAALFLIWKYADKVVGFFEGLYTWFTKLGTGMKILVGALMAIFWPITLVAALIYGLAKLFQSIKKIGFKATMIAIWEWIKAILPKIWTWIKNLGKTIIDGVMWFINMIGDAVMGFGAMIWKGMKDAGKAMWKGIKWFFSLIWKGIKSIFGIFLTFYTWLFNFYMGIINFVFIAPFMFVWNSLKGIWSKVKSVFSKIFKIFGKLWDSLKSVFAWKNIKASFLGIVKSIVSALGGLFSSAGSMIKKTVMSIWKGVKSLFAKIGDFFRGVKIWARSIFSGKNLSMGASANISSMARNSGVDSDRVSDIVRGETKAKGSKEIAMQKALWKELGVKNKSEAADVKDSALNKALANLADKYERGAVTVKSGGGTASHTTSGKSKKP